jgi:hypothetical protein
LEVNLKDLARFSVGLGDQSVGCWGVRGTSEEIYNGSMFHDSQEMQTPHLRLKP